MPVHHGFVNLVHGEMDGDRIGSERTGQGQRPLRRAGTGSARGERTWASCRIGATPSVVLQTHPDREEHP
jgi:hypothetical protein